jgi:uncharacterized protein with HEPN domain
MQRDVLAALHDMREAVERIAEASLGHDYHSFVDSWILVSAIERQFGIIGEALVRIRERDRDLFDQIPDATKIVGLRNLIVHGYDAIDPEILWSVIEERLAGLRSLLSGLLENQ